MSSVFDAYASYYDLLYRDKDYAAEAEYVGAQIREHQPHARSILELGCGTGAHAIHLAQQGYNVHGIDLSAAMVERALLRARQAPLQLAARLSFVEGDVRTVRSGALYDIVVSLFHVISYQTANADLDAAFATAAAHLREGGLFFFDFWYGPAVLTQRPEVRVKRLENEQIKVTRIAEPAMRVNENVVDVNYTLFIEDKVSGGVHQFAEAHPMRYLFLPEIERLCEGRFRLESSYAWMTNRTLAQEDWAGCVALRRLAESDE